MTNDLRIGSFKGLYNTPVQELIILFLLNCPAFITDLLIIYHSGYDYAGGEFANLSYNYTLFGLIISVWGIFAYKKRLRIVNMYLILLLVLCKDGILHLLGSPTPFSLNSWELYLSPIYAMSCCVIVANYEHNANELNRFLDWLIIINFIYQILFLMTGRVMDSGRVSVIGQGVVSVGYMCALHIMHILLTRKLNLYCICIIIISFLSILLSGTRFCLFFVIIGSIVFAKHILMSIEIKKRKTIIITFLFIVCLIGILLSSSTIATQFESVNRISSLTDGNTLENISQDQSLLERIHSIMVGFEILADYPLGVANSYVILQGYTIDYGFFAFPHSNLLTYYLLWGIPFLFCVAWLFRTMALSFRTRQGGVGRMMIYIIVCFAIYGGIETSVKSYVYIFALFSVYKRQILESSQQI